MNRVQAEFRMRSCLALAALLLAATTSFANENPNVTASVNSAGSGVQLVVSSMARTGGEPITNVSTLSVSLAGAAGGQIIPIVNNAPQAAQTISSADAFSIPLLQEGTNIVSVLYTPTGAGRKQIGSNSIAVTLDTTGPIARRCELVELPGLGTTVMVTFDESDLGSINDGLTVIRQDKEGNFVSGNAITTQNPIAEGRQIRLPILNPPAGTYQLQIDKSKVVDLVGNEAGSDQKLVFAVPEGRRYGHHVEFSPYAPPKKQTIPEEGFNPGDFVETRVARLYYFRDANRVAQIINRNVRSLNHAAVTHAERRAETSRIRADDATDERREKERVSVRAAQQAREAENRLAEAQQKLAEAQQLDNTVSEDQAEIAELDAEINRLTATLPAPASVATPLTPAEAATQQQINQLTNRRDALNRSIASNERYKRINFGDTNTLAGQVATERQNVSHLRQLELSSRDEWNNAQAKEERSRANQFRDEVTAAKTDPDTYVAGDPASVDPVTQVSISVIGEGLIQLRGPIKGINKIRTMINQIDSPVGQIKVGLFTVQVNGEDGEKMEKVVGDAEGYIDLARFQVNQSLNLLRRSIQSEAAILAEQCDHNGHYQVDRDRRYLYSFFGRDFIDELYEMNSEFLFSENKLLSLHSMDTVSFNRALFMLALAKNDLRERIVNRFLESVKTELPDAEYDFRRSSELKPHRTQKLLPPWNLTHLPLKNRHKKEALIHEAVHRNALQRYHFRNFASYFNVGFVNSDTMNPMQREFIRLAQMFKARLVAEMEWKQRVLERGLIEDRSNNENRKAEIMAEVNEKALQLSRQAYLNLIASEGTLQEAYQVASDTSAIVGNIELQIGKLDPIAKNILNNMATNSTLSSDKTIVEGLRPEFDDLAETLIGIEHVIQTADWLTEQQRGTALAQARFAPPAGLSLPTRFSEMRALIPAQVPFDATKAKNLKGKVSSVMTLASGVPNRLRPTLRPVLNSWKPVGTSVATLIQALERSKQSLTSFDQRTATTAYNQAIAAIEATGDSERAIQLKLLLTEAYDSYQESKNAELSIQRAEDLLERTRVDLDHRKLLDHLIDEQEERFIELVEGTRSHISVMDQYLKRLSIALEDDFKIQFYDPAFVRVREASRGRSVNLSQVERTTVLTNNRAFAKVDPQATMEFDLPKRQIAIKEAFGAAKALVEDAGALMNDPTFLSAFQMMGGSSQAGTVKNLLPGQSMALDQQDLGLASYNGAGGSGGSVPGSALQSLVPEPSVFKLETGTGFQLRPVMQPDGDSAVYDFDYMYTTNIREPVRADEKHIGRVKRHFVHTAVQTGNFELREVSRYQVALKVSRTSRGVPLLEDIPVVGAVFRPAPSDEASLQQNIIFGQTNLYPTLYDLMGLRWAQQIVDLSHESLLESEHVIRGRQRSMRNFVFGEASARVDRFLNIQGKSPENYRVDLYREQALPSPHHPRGFSVMEPIPDPTGRKYERIDRRPPEMQDPPYDLYRHRPANPETIGPGYQPESIPPRTSALKSVMPSPDQQWSERYGNEAGTLQRLLDRDSSPALETVPVEVPLSEKMGHLQRIDQSIASRAQRIGQTSARRTFQSPSKAWSATPVKPVSFDQVIRQPESPRLKRLPQVR